MRKNWKFSLCEVHQLRMLINAGGQTTFLENFVSCFNKNIDKKTRQKFWKNKFGQKMIEKLRKHCKQKMRWLKRCGDERHEQIFLLLKLENWRTFSWFLYHRAFSFCPFFCSNRDKRTTEKCRTSSKLASESLKKER